MTALRYLLLALLAFAVVGCNTKEKYAANNAAGWAWVQKQNRPPQFILNGVWQSEDWGGAQFFQNGSSVTGTMGDYNIRGTVSGPRAYLLLESDGWIYYTVVLAKPVPNVLRGYYSSEVPFHVDDQKEIEFRRQEFW